MQFGRPELRQAGGKLGILSKSSTGPSPSLKNSISCRLFRSGLIKKPIDKKGGLLETERDLDLRFAI